jgi:Protein of unknown function (DUF3071)
MKRLYLLGFTHDLKGVVFGERKGAKTATVWIPIDDAFNDAIRKLDRARTAKAEGGKGKAKKVKDEPPAIAEGEAGRPLPPVGRSQVAAGMRPSEIQQLLRQGRSVNSVAEASKTSREWVERLAEPVIAERVGVVRMAQNAMMPRPRLGPSGLPLGEAVRRNLKERRAPIETIERLDDAWDARLSRAGGWRVFLRFNHRGKRRTAEWEFHKGRREILPRNRLAGQLGWWPTQDADEPEQIDTREDTGEIDAEEAAALMQLESPRPVRRRRRPPAHGGAKRNRPSKPKRKASRSTTRKRAPRKKAPARRRRTSR